VSKLHHLIPFTATVCGLLVALIEGQAKFIVLDSLLLDFLLSRDYLKHLKRS